MKNSKTSDNSIMDLMAVAISGAPFPSKKSRAKAISVLVAMKSPVENGEFGPRNQVIFNGMIDAIIAGQGGQLK